uniref:Uncharacterized protein n=1 Tax=uncultured Nocardioidaceae bacterium TaxID=253824 RepID=A0A6J4LNV0_9ACTN|nr:MAG: hypothetical protein AVDCRST_MAG46-1681 [uncultured Nocardioidaceae bacterium]
MRSPVVRVGSSLEGHRPRPGCDMATWEPAGNHLIRVTKQT